MNSCICKCLTQVLPVGPFIALHVEQRVPMVKNFGSGRTLWVIYCLTVPCYKKAMINRWGAWGTHGSWQPIRAWWSWKSSWTWKIEEKLVCLVTHSPERLQARPIKYNRPSSCYLSLGIFFYKWEHAIFEMNKFGRDLASVASEEFWIGMSVIFIEVFSAIYFS